MVYFMTSVCQVFSSASPKCGLNYGEVPKKARNIRTQRTCHEIRQKPATVSVFTDADLTIIQNQAMFFCLKVHIEVVIVHVPVPIEPMASNPRF